MDGYLPAWLITIISLVGSTIITTIVGLIIKHYFQKYVDKKAADEKEDREKDAELTKFREEQQRQERKADIVASVQEVVQPLADKIDAINKKLDKVEDGTLSTLRNDILTCYYRCVEKGYRNDYDYQNIHHMYDSYAELHGNSYVHDIMKRFDELPVKEEVKEVSIDKPKRKYTKKASSKNEIDKE